MRHVIALNALLIAGMIHSAPTEAQGLGMGARGAGKLRGRVKRMIHFMRMQQIIGVLNLSEKQAPRFFALINSFEQKSKQARRQIRQAYKTIKQMVRTSQFDAHKINALINGIMKRQVQIKQLEWKRFQAVRKLLSAEQTAKLVLALPRIERRIRRMIRRARRRRRGRRHNPWP